MHVDSDLQLVIMADKVTNLIAYILHQCNGGLKTHRIQCMQEFFIL